MIQIEDQVLFDPENKKIIFKLFSRAADANFKWRKRIW